MQHTTLKFRALSDLSIFSRMLPSGYVINTITLSISGAFAPSYVTIAKMVYEATEV